MADVSAKLRINYILFSLIERIVTDEKKTVIDDLCLNK